MTVLTNGAPVTTPRGSVLGAFVPKPRAVTIDVDRPARTRRSLRDRFAGRGKQIKDAVVATVAFGSMTAAAFEWHPWAGMVAAGISVLLIDHSVDRDEVSDGRAP